MKICTAPPGSFPGSHCLAVECLSLLNVGSPEKLEVVTWGEKLQPFGDKNHKPTKLGFIFLYSCLSKPENHGLYSPLLFDSCGYNPGLLKTDVFLMGDTASLQNKLVPSKDWNAEINPNFSCLAAHWSMKCWEELVTHPTHWAPPPGPAGWVAPAPRLWKGACATMDRRQVLKEATFALKNEKLKSWGFRGKKKAPLSSWRVWAEVYSFLASSKPVNHHWWDLGWGGFLRGRRGCGSLRSTLGHPMMELGGLEIFWGWLNLELLVEQGVGETKVTAAVISTRISDRISAAFLPIQVHWFTLGFLAPIFPPQMKSLGSKMASRYLSPSPIPSFLFFLLFSTQDPTLEDI